MNTEDDEGPDPDYGVFGDAGQPRVIPPMPSAYELRRAALERQRREAGRKTSQDFNRHMIDLYNGARRGES